MGRSNDNAKANANRTRRRLRRGFTLVELLVAMVLAAVVMYGVYTLYERSSSAFRVQNQLTGMQQQLRFGVEHLKREIDRAGFLATSNSVADGDVCFNAATQAIHGVILHRDAEEGWDAVHLRASNAFVSPTSITMFGDFWSQGPLRVHSVSGSQIVLDGSFGYAVDPTQPNQFPDILQIEDWFRPGRMVRLVNQSGLEMYYFVSNVVPNAGGPPGASWPVLVLTQPVPVSYAGDGCGVQGVGGGVLVNPVGYVRYRIAPDERAGAPADKYDLVREEMNPNDPVNQIVPRSQITIAEYAVDLQFYDFIFDDGTREQPSLSTVGNAASFPIVADVVATGGGGRLSNDDTADTHRLRALTFKLSVRTPDEDPNVVFRPRRTTTDRLTTFEVNPEPMGAARVRSLTGRVVLNNFVTRNLLPAGIAGGP